MNPMDLDLQHKDLLKKPLLSSSQIFLSCGLASSWVFPMFKLHISLCLLLQTSWFNTSHRLKKEDCKHEWTWHEFIFHSITSQSHSILSNNDTVSSGSHFWTKWCIIIIDCTAVTERKLGLMVAKCKVQDFYTNPEFICDLVRQQGGHQTTSFVFNVFIEWHLTAEMTYCAFKSSSDFPSSPNAFSNPSRYFNTKLNGLAKKKILSNSNGSKTMIPNDFGDP